MVKIIIESCEGGHPEDGFIAGNATGVIKCETPTEQFKPVKEAIDKSYSDSKLLFDSYAKNTQS